jgi:hypothetical protein
MANLNWFQMLLKKLDMSGKVGLAKKKKKKKKKNLKNIIFF